MPPTGSSAKCSARLVWALVGLVLGATAALAAGDHQEATAAAANATAKVKLGVFYESRCPDSRRFFQGQLVPVYRDLGDEHIEAELVPFGHAQTLANERMLCQHGPRECDGNRLMGCVQKYGAPVVGQLKVIETVACLFGPELTSKQCLEQRLTTDAKLVEAIEKCASSSESFAMMQDFEKLTGHVGYVPHITANGESSSEIQQACETDLRRCVCDRLATKPAVCAPPVS